MQKHQAWMGMGLLLINMFYLFAFGFFRGTCIGWIFENALAILSESSLVYVGLLWYLKSK